PTTPQHLPHQFSLYYYQAEDGIRDRNVTGVQTCALPICPFTKASRQTRKLDNCNCNLTYNITINLCDFHRAISYRDAVECEYNPWYYCEYSMRFRSGSMYNIFKTVESRRLDKFDDFIKAILRYYIIFFLFYI